MRQGLIDEFVRRRSNDRGCLHKYPIQEKGKHMSAADIANRHLTAALSDAKAEGVDTDALCRSLLGLIVSTYLETRSVADVQSELRFIADNCDPDTDFAFMRP
jgi:hypothetical protein